MFADTDGPDVEIVAGQITGRRKQRVGLNSRIADSSSLETPARDSPLRQFWYPVMFTSKARSSSVAEYPNSLHLHFSPPHDKSSFLFYASQGGPLPLTSFSAVSVFFRIYAARSLTATASGSTMRSTRFAPPPPVPNAPGL